MPSIVCPAHNTNSSVAISTSVGFRFLEAEQYHEAIGSLRPDVSTGMADIIGTEDASLKRVEKSADRTHAWVRDYLEEQEPEKTSPFFASLPPAETELMALYLSDLGDEYKRHISGLCIYSPSSVVGLPDSLKDMPTICLSDPTTPQAILGAIHAGVDLITVPFVTQTSEHGIALTFTFSSSTADTDTNTTPNKPLGIDLWSTAHAKDLSPLVPNCPCYTCTRHHRAYVHHLLQASEMLAWTLLQIHNFHVFDTFFAAIRASIERRSFSHDLDIFHAAYESEMPKQTGQGPRVRGYQMKSMGRGEQRKNPRAYGKLDEQMEKLAEAQSGAATPEGDADEIERHGLAEKVAGL